jgi:hypothetical protein
MFERIKQLFNSNSLNKQLADEKAQNRALQRMLAKSLEASQETIRQQQASLDRVIASRFDVPYSGHSPAAIQNPTFPFSTLSDQFDEVLELPDSEFLAL